MRRIEREGLQRSPESAYNDPLAAIAPHVAEIELEAPPFSPDRPEWTRDALTLSRRAREYIARLRPVALKVLTFWDHVARSIAVDGARIAIDASGSYRLAR
uniref:Uncharacterized protein n=1 Tax=mine drainage metagenome TaxID=410659 RepID=E6Q807_9ZZZZ